MFVAPRGYKLVRADFNQLQFRTLAAVSGDETIIAALNANKKIHQVTADILGITYDRAKTVNFGAMFGQEAWALSHKGTTNNIRKLPSAGRRIYWRGVGYSQRRWIQRRIRRQMWRNRS